MSKASEFFAYQGKRGRKYRCGVCCNQEAVKAVRDILAAAQDDGKHVAIVALGEWIVKKYDLDMRPKSIESHLRNHETELWGKLRG